MSYTVDIIHVAIPADDLAAWDFLDNQLRVSAEDDTRPLPESVQELYRRLTDRFPCISESPEGPWADGPLLRNFGHDLTILAISFSRVEEVLPFLISTANDLGFVVFDGQDERFHRPGHPAGRHLPELEAAAEATRRAAEKARRPWWRLW